MAGKAEPFKDRETTKLVLRFRRITLAAISRRSWRRLEVGSHYNSPGKGCQSLEPGKKQSNGNKGMNTVNKMC